MPESKKTVQVRIPVRLAADAGLVASAFGGDLAAYVTRVVQEAVTRDLPAAARIASERAAATRDPDGAKSRRRKPEP